MAVLIERMGFVLGCGTSFITRSRRTRSPPVRVDCERVPLPLYTGARALRRGGGGGHCGPDN